MTETIINPNTKTPQQQLWEFLKTKEQKVFIAERLRSLKQQVQEDICYGLIAYFLYSMRRQFCDRWVQQHFNGLVNYLQNEQLEGRL